MEGDIYMSRDDFNIDFDDPIWKRSLGIPEGTFCCHHLGFCAGSREANIINKILEEGNKDFARLSIDSVENVIYIIQKLGYRIIKEKLNG